MLLSGLFPWRAALLALPLALMLALMLALTGCGSDAGGNDNGVASANDGDQADGGSDAPPSENDTHQQMLAYAQCLRDQGLDVEDPAPGKGVQLQNEGDPSKTEAALKACEDKAPPPPADSPDENDVRKEMLELAKCMRAAKQSTLPVDGFGFT